VHDLTRRPNGEPGHVSGAREGLIGGGAIALAPMAHQVARHVVMHQRRARCQRLLRRDDRRQHLVIDHQRFGRVARLVERVGHDHGHDIADMAHLADRHRQMRWLAVTVAGGILDFADGGQMSQPVGRGVFSRVDRRDTGRGQRRRFVDAGEAGVRMGRAHEQHGQGIARRGVLGITAAAGQ
jgi:hypothetical protein